MPTPDAPSRGWTSGTGTERTFVHLLVNHGVVNVLNYTVWFALTFWVFLATRSLFATGTIAGSSSWRRRRRDLVRQPRRRPPQADRPAGVGRRVVPGLRTLPRLYLLTPGKEFADVGSWQLWVFIVLLMRGHRGEPAGHRLPTLVTLLVPADRRDRANGLLGTVGGCRCS